MVLSLIIASSVVLGATETRPEAFVVISKRSGLARGPALELGRAFADALKTAGVPVPSDIEEVNCSSGKVTCLVDAARKKGAAVVVTLELGSVLGDVVLHSEALSVDEDGKKLSSWDEEGPLATLKSKLSGLSTSFAPAIVTALGLNKPVAAAPVVETSALVPPPPPVWVAPPTVAIDARPVEPAGWSNPRRAGAVMMGVGAGGLIASAVLGGLTLSTVGQRNAICPGVCTSPKAFELDRSARSTQTIGIIMAVGGGLVAATGTVMFMVNAGEDRAGVAVSGQF